MLLDVFGEVGVFVDWQLPDEGLHEVRLSLHDGADARSPQPGSDDVAVESVICVVGQLEREAGFAKSFEKRSRRRAPLRRLFFVFGILHNVLWYAAYRAGVTMTDLTLRERRTLTLAWAAGPVLYGLCLALALVDPRLSIAGFAVIAILFLLPTPQIVALAQRTRRRRREGQQRA